MWVPQLLGLFLSCLIADHTASVQTCNDEIWCTVAMPTKSLFRFDPPTDKKRWRQAQIQAASGEQVLMKKVRDVFPNTMDFLDGDELFRDYNNIADMHVDHNRDFAQLVGPTQTKPKKVKTYNWESSPASRPDHVLPKDYDVHSTKRAPVVLLGYNVFEKSATGPYFNGVHAGEAVSERPHMFGHFQAVKNNIKKPLILLHGANENWGIFSTIFPNRTVDWGSCCVGEKGVYDILKHDKLALFMVTQHHNLTHPKLLTLPRGMALTWERKRSILWDIIHTMPDTTRKENLVFTASSSWKHRPIISECIASKFVSTQDKKELMMRSSGDGGQRKTPRAEMDYYKRLASARMGIALPGLGYDTFRLWETLTMGTVAVLEKGVGLDKTLWRLPALLVEDFDEVTPSLLRVAYVEALYRASAGDFEFERLTQSFWWSFVMNVSTSAGTSARAAQEAIYAKFPPQSEDPTFARPLVPYSCGVSGERCGRGTKRTPKSSCGGKS